MLKTIDAAQLRVGMFIHEFECSWLDHPFLNSRFLVSEAGQLERIRAAGISRVTIDCARGMDALTAPNLDEAAAATEAAMRAIATAPVRSRRVSVEEESGRAVAIRRQAASLVRTVMQDARLGRAVQLDQVAPVIEGVTGSILRNAGALLGLSIIKDKDNYTFLHSVSVCTLMVAFCHSRNMDAETVRQAGIGGLLHDVGKTLVPDAILNKPGRLTEEEFVLLRRHPSDGHEILCRSPEIGPIPLDITLHHHERCDGSGYPDRLETGAISELAQMAAIVDVYDAITADRCYHKGMPAAQALRKMLEWSKYHFAPGLLQEFIRCVGIYPVGTLVLLESGMLGVVVEAHESNLLTPKLRVFYSAKRKSYVQPYLLDLARPVGHGGADRILGYESADRWGLDPARFMNAA